MSKTTLKKFLFLIRHFSLRHLRKVDNLGYVDEDEGPSPKPSGARKKALFEDKEFDGVMRNDEMGCRQKEAQKRTEKRMAKESEKEQKKQATLQRKKEVCKQNTDQQKEQRRSENEALKKRKFPYITCCQTTTHYDPQKIQAGIRCIECHTFRHIKIPKVDAAPADAAPADVAPPDVAPANITRCYQVIGSLIRIISLC